MKGTLSLSWGPSGGFYFLWGKPASRLCLWWVAITYIRGVEIDTLMNAYVNEKEKA